MHSVVPLHYKTPCYVLPFSSKFSVLEEVHKVFEESGHSTTSVFYLSKFKSSFVLLEFLFDIEEGGGGLQSSSLRCKCLDQVEKMQVAQSAAHRVRHRARHRECTGRNCVFYRLERWLCSRITGGPCTLMTAFKPFKAGGDSSCFPRTSTYASRHQRRRLQLDGSFTAAAFIKRGPIWRWQKNNKNLMLMHHRG